MLCLARATRALSHGAVFCHSTQIDAVTTLPWTGWRSLHATPDKSRTSGEPSRPQNRSDVPSRRVRAKPTQRPHHEQSLLPKVSYIPSKKVDHRNKVVASLKSDDLGDTMGKGMKLEARSTGKSVSIRRVVKPLPPTVVFFSDLAVDTLITDVLLSIREASMVGKLSSDNARIYEARMRQRRAKHTSASAAVDFREPSGAEKIHSLSQAGQFTIRGLVPRTSLKWRRGPSSFITPHGVRKPTPLSRLMTADPVEKRGYLDKLKEKDHLVRRTHLNYNRDPSSAMEDEGKLAAGAVFKSIFMNAPHESTGNSEHEQHPEADEASKG